jgi:hypothetical protein
MNSEILSIQQDESDNAFIKRRKKVVSKNYKSTKSKSIDEATQLAVYLLSMNKQQEAESLLDSFCELTPYAEYPPQRWMAIAQAILLSAYIKKENGDYTESERLKSLVEPYDYDPIPGAKAAFYSRLYESLNSTLFETIEINHHEKCAIHAEHYLLFIYGVLLKPELSSAFENITGKVLKNDMVSQLKRLCDEINTK